MIPLIENTWAAALKRRQTLFLTAIVLFPTATNLISHSGSIYLTVFTLAGLPLLLSSRYRPAVHPHEKWVMGAFAAYSVVYVSSFMLNGLSGTLTDLRLSNLDHEIRFLAFIPIFVLFRTVRMNQFALWAGVLSGALLSGGYAMLSYFWWAPGVRVSGSYHSIAFGDLSLVLAFMSIPAQSYFQNKSIVYRLLPTVALIFGLVASILSGTRGAWIAFPALIIILFYYLSPMMGLFPRLACLAVVGILLSATYYIPGSHIGNRVDAFFEEIKNYRDGDRGYSSIGTRIEGWQVAWNIFVSHPVIGAGPGNYEPLMERMIAAGQQYNSAAAHKQPHGAFPSSMADTGILGLLALLGVFLLPLRVAIRFLSDWHPLRNLGYAMMVLVVGFMHFGLTETIFSRNINVVFYIIFTSLIMAVAANELENRPTSQESGQEPGLTGAMRTAETASCQAISRKQLS